MMDGGSGDATAGDGAANARPTVTVAVPGLHGTVTAFDGSQEEWVEHGERLDNHFIANDMWTLPKRELFC